MAATLTFGAELYALRRLKRISQQALADAAAISRNYLSEIENEKRIPPPAEVCERLLNALGADESSRQRILAASADARLMIGTRVSRAVPAHVDALFRELARLSPKLSRADAQRIRRLLQEI